MGAGEVQKGESVRRKTVVLKVWKMDKVEETHYRVGAWGVGRGGGVREMVLRVRKMFGNVRWEIRFKVENYREIGNR